MQLYLCRVCGYFRDVTAISFFAGITFQTGQYNETVTHCPNCKTAMYQVQKGDRLAIIVQNDEEEIKQCGWCNDDACKHCGKCHDTQCYEYEEECKENERP